MIFDITQAARGLRLQPEGATKLLEVTVKDASSFAQAKRVAKSIVNSPLVKTAVFAADPNWGRVAMAIGKCEEQTTIVPDKVSIAFGDLTVYQGRPLPQDQLPELKAYLQQPEVAIHVSLGLGEHSATVWGCDLTYEYVKINGEYTTQHEETSCDEGTSYSKNGPDPYVVVQFTDTQGTTRTATIYQSDGGVSSHFHDPVGQTIPIRYRADNPGSVEVEGTSAGKVQSYQLLSILAGSFSLAFCIWGLIRVPRKPQPKHLSEPVARG